MLVFSRLKFLEFWQALLYRRLDLIINSYYWEIKLLVDISASFWWNNFFILISQYFIYWCIILISLLIHEKLIFVMSEFYVVCYFTVSFDTDLVSVLLFVASKGSHKQAKVLCVWEIVPLCRPRPQRHYDTIIPIWQTMYGSPAAVDHSFKCQILI